MVSSDQALGEAGGGYNSLQILKSNSSRLVLQKRCNDQEPPRDKFYANVL